MAEQDTAAAGRAADQLAVSADLPSVIPPSASATAPSVGAPIQPPEPAIPSSSRATIGDLHYARLANNIQDAVNTPGGQAVLNSPNGLMKMLVAGTLDALATKPAPPPSNAQRFAEGLDKFVAPLSNLKGSAFEGAGNVAKADLEQREKDRKEAEARNRQMTQDQREKLNFGLNVAQANMNMIHSQRLLHNDMEVERDKNIEDSKKALENLKNQPLGAVPIQEGITADKYKELVQQNTDDIAKGIPAKDARGIDPTKTTAFATDKKQVLDKNGNPLTDENGNPQYQNTYTVVRLPEKYQFTSKDDFMELGKYILPNLSDKELDGIGSQIDKDHPWSVSGADYNAAFQARETAQAATGVARKAVLAAGGDADKVEEMDFAGNHIWAQDLAAASKLTDLGPAQQFMAARAMMLQNPPKDSKGNLMFKNIDRDIAHALGEQNIAALTAKAETERKDRENEKIKTAEAANKARELELKRLSSGANFMGDQSASTPEAFYNSLDSNAKATVDMIYSGRAPLQKADYLLARKPEVLAAVERAHPGEFDGSKVAGYPKLWADYTSNNPKSSGGQLAAGSVALQHLARLKQINDENPVAVHNPTTAAYKEYNNLLDTVTDELGTFYAEPKTNEVIQSKKATLGGLLNRDAAIVEQVKAMGVKFDALENKWKEGAPSKAYEAKMPDVSQESKLIRAKLDPAFAQRLAQEQQPRVAPQQAAKPQAPSNAQSEISDKNGVFWGWKLKDGTYQKAPGVK